MVTASEVECADAASVVLVAESRAPKAITMDLQHTLSFDFTLNFALKSATSLAFRNISFSLKAFPVSIVNMIDIDTQLWQCCSCG